MWISMGIRLRGACGEPVLIRAAWRALRRGHVVLADATGAGARPL